MLLNLFTLSLNGSTVPANWKRSVIVPIHKKGPLHEVSNYRPINHTPVLSRIMEKIVKDNIISYLLSLSLINHNQHGFLRSRSCMTCQYDFLNLVTDSAESGKSLVVLYLDLSKAFDRVPHPHLLTKLRSFGIVDPLLSWFSSYLSHRSQVVLINGHTSNPKPVTSGVIQGSVLGPLLFLLYINDMFATILNGTPFFSRTTSR